VLESAVGDLLLSCDKPPGDCFITVRRERLMSYTQFVFRREQAEQGNPFLPLHLVLRIVQEAQGCLFILCLCLLNFKGVCKVQVSSAPTMLGWKVFEMTSSSSCG